MLREFPSWERRSGLAGRSRAVRREASLPCRREPSVETLGKGLRGFRARRWLLSPAMWVPEIKLRPSGLEAKTLYLMKIPHERKDGSGNASSWESMTFHMFV